MRNRVRLRREQLGLSQKELAVRLDISRQTLTAIESERQTPSVIVALRLAHALSTHVEALFADHAPDNHAPGPIDAALAGRLRGQATRVLACELRGHYVAHPMATAQPSAQGTVADGIARATAGRRGRVCVELAASLEQVRENLMIAGSAPGLPLLCDYLNRAPGPGRFRWLPRPQRAALTALAKGHVHVAGAHVAQPSARDCRRTLARYLPSASAHVIELARCELGLIFGARGEGRLAGFGALADPAARLALCEPAPDVRAEVCALLARAQLAPDAVLGRALFVHSQSEVARSVARGVASVGLCNAAAARELNFAFEPCLQEPVGLIIPDDIRDPRITRLRDTLSSPALQRELRTLGYDTQMSGRELARLSLEA
jgi:DNA-binding XRE family transcriptional regulator/molybdate-binding protein